MDGEYQKLHIKRPPPRSLRQTTEGKYWRRFAAPTTIQQVCSTASTRCKSVDRTYRAETQWWQSIIDSTAWLPSAKNCGTPNANAHADWHRLAHRLQPNLPSRLCCHQRNSGMSPCKAAEHPLQHIHEHPALTQANLSFRPLIIDRFAFISHDIAARQTTNIAQ